MMRFLLILMSLNVMLLSSAQASPCADSFVVNTKGDGCYWQGEGASTVTIDALAVTDNYKFSGLATYLNAAMIIFADDNKTVNLQAGDSLELSEQGKLIVLGRFNAAVFNAEDVVVDITAEQLSFRPLGEQPLSLSYTVVSKNSATLLLTPVKYQHLWGFLAVLAEFVELSLVSIDQLLNVGWGFAVVILAIAIKILLIPVSIAIVNFQRSASKYQAILEPQLREIKSKYDGEEAHERIMAAHKALGVTPFYTLKPMLGTLIQIPILIAVFNALGEMPQFDGAPFFWITNLAYPDALFSMPINIPFLGDTFNLLPFLMTAVTIVSTLLFKNQFASTQELGRQRFKLYMMAVAFFVLFYPFPAVMVLYWTMANILHAIQQQFIKI